MVIVVAARLHGDRARAIFIVNDVRQEPRT
jgi:hypothetical protein